MADKKLIQRARAAKSPEELLKLAEENGMADFTEEEAEEYFKILNRSGELSDSELENASGGCKKGGKRVVTMGTVFRPSYGRERQVLHPVLEVQNLP